MDKIRKLYAIEAEIEKLSSIEKLTIRQQNIKPLLNNLHEWLEKNVTRLVPGSLIHKAMSYALNLCPRLARYYESGDLSISNAPAENVIRPFAVGRHNWLFADTPNCAKASAMLYSLVESVKTNGLEPYANLNPILKELTYADTLDKLGRLLSLAVKASQE